MSKKEFIFRCPKCGNELGEDGFDGFLIDVPMIVEHEALNQVQIGHVQIDLAKVDGDAHTHCCKCPYQDEFRKFRIMKKRDVFLKLIATVKFECEKENPLEDEGIIKCLEKAAEFPFQHGFSDLPHGETKSWDIQNLESEEDKGGD
jgi:hypothetical protein